MSRNRFEGRPLRVSKRDCSLMSSDLICSLNLLSHLEIFNRIYDAGVLNVV
jgi:hypothetical protein